MRCYQISAAVKSILNTNGTETKSRIFKGSKSKTCFQLSQPSITTNIWSITTNSCSPLQTTCPGSIFFFKLRRRDFTSLLTKVAISVLELEGIMDVCCCCRLLDLCITTHSIFCIMASNQGVSNHSQYLGVNQE